jgi:hypothetical protein
VVRLGCDAACARAGEPGLLTASGTGQVPLPRGGLAVAVLAAMSLPLAANLPYSAAIAALTLLSAALLVAAGALWTAHLP